MHPPSLPPSLPSSLPSFQSPPCSSLTPRPTAARLRQAKLFFIWLHGGDDDGGEEEVGEVLRHLGSSATLCPLDLRPGLYDPDNAFVFLLGPPGEEEGGRRRRLGRLFGDKEVRRHARVAAFSSPTTPARESAETLIVTRFNFYQVKEQGEGGHGLCMRMCPTNIGDC